MKLTNATTKAIRYACLNFHYAKAVPQATYAYNIFNKKNEWCGVIIYGTGANPRIGEPYGLYQGEVLELVRVALNGKQETTSECLAASLKLLHKQAPRIKLVVSYADLDQDHMGIIYQATNWIYQGERNEGMISAYIVNGVKIHKKTLCDKFYKDNNNGDLKLFEWIKKTLDPNTKKFMTKGKHKYIYVFDKKLRRKYLNQSLPYPKK